MQAVLCRLALGRVALGRVVFGRVVFGVAALSCVACGAEPAASSDSTSRVVLGTGLEQYEALAGEPAVPLIKGIQGGFHVWTSFLAYGFATDVLRMELSTSWDGVPDSLIEMPGNVSVRPVVDAAGEEALTSVGWPALIYNPTCAHGHRLRIELLVRDEVSGQSASDTRFCIADVPVADRASDCAALR